MAGWIGRCVDGEDDQPLLNEDLRVEIGFDLSREEPTFGVVNEA